MPVPRSSIRGAAASDVAEQHEAAAGRAVMAGAEGERRLDLDAELVHAHGAAIMLAMQQKPSGADRREAGERVRDPIGLLHAAEFHLGGERRARHEADELADLRLVRRRAEIGLDDPRALDLGPVGRLLEGAGRVSAGSKVSTITSATCRAVVASGQRRRIR